jgi:histidinol-phosphatase (PHP family)
LSLYKSASSDKAVKISGDYHVHCYLSRHGEGEITEYVESAISKGLKRIGFSEHIPVPGLDDPSGRMPIKDFDVYIRDVREAQQQYKDDIEVLFGLEADYLPPFQDNIVDFIGQYPFDFVIGSVHFIDDWDFSNPAYRDEFVRRGVDTSFQTYYRLVGEAIESGCYDIIGHLDLINRYGYTPSFDLEPLLTAVLEKVQRSGCALDMNTSGLRKGVGVIFPGVSILSRAQRLGIPVVPGSDAHHPGDVGADFDRAGKMLAEIGFKQSMFFRKRKPEYEPLMNSVNGTR